ncbi:MAG: hypothetical protein LUG98_03080 [Tannerellaceae bacterium]|nr:hypothetical protein [Tannerellaceae bacterium]
MKKYSQLIIATGILVGCFACNDTAGDPAEPGEERVPVEGVSLELDGLESSRATRAVSDYAVNKAAYDPTYTLAGRETWELEVTIYSGDTVYVDGEAVFEKVTDTYQNENRWEPTRAIYFPNYTTQRVALNLHPVGWTAITTDQSSTDGSGLLEQDVLEQNGNSTIAVAPAHIPSVVLRHAHSMLDFRLTNVDEDEIGEVTVLIGNEVYIPYQVQNVSNPEYMLIVPVGTSTPVISINTVGGARYLQTTVDRIQSTTVNTCYCFTFEGLELKLGEITIAEWTTGPGIIGEYTQERSYPTFRGPPNVGATLYFDNGLSQDILFNDQGESNERPVGRRIIRIQTDRSIEDVDIVLDGMVIDLTRYLEAFFIDLDEEE